MLAKTFRKLRHRRGIALIGTLVAALALAAGLQALAAAPASALPREQGCEITETCSEEGGGWGGEGGGGTGEEGGGGGEESGGEEGGGGGGGGSEEGDDEPEPSQGEVEEKEISDWENEEIEAREASEEQEAAEREEKELSDRENKELEEKEKDDAEEPLRVFAEERRKVEELSARCDALFDESLAASDAGDEALANSKMAEQFSCAAKLAQERKRLGLPDPNAPGLILIGPVQSTPAVPPSKPVPPPTAKPPARSPGHGPQARAPDTGRSTDPVPSRSNSRFRKPHGNVAKVRIAQAPHRS